MIYPNQVIFQGGVLTKVAVDDAWVLANKPRTLLLTADKTTIDAADPPMDYATITVQLRTPMLTDGSYDNLAVAGDVVVLVDDEPTTVTLDGDGAGSFTIDSVEAGVFGILGESLNSGVIEIEAV